MAAPTDPSLVSGLILLATGAGGAQVISWYLHRNAERATVRANNAQADASETEAAVARLTLIDKLSDRMTRLEQQNEAMRGQLEQREVSHREEIAQRDKLIASQQLLLAQQQTEIEGLKEKVSLLRHDLEQWRLAAREGRDALRETLLAATAPATPPVTGGEGETP